MDPERVTIKIRKLGYRVVAHVHDFGGEDHIIQANTIRAGIAMAHRPIMLHQSCRSQ